MEKRHFTYEEAQDIVLKKGIQSVGEYRSIYKELGLPASPQVYFKNKGWISWPIFLCKKRKEYPSYKQIQRIVQEEGIKSQLEYKSKCKELGLPAKPYKVYADKGWTNWYDFLGKSSPSYPSYEEAKNIIQKRGVNTQKEYNSIYKELGVPACPQQSYADKGWIDWYDYLGKSSPSYPSYEDAQRIVKEAGIKSITQYQASYKELRLPSNPNGYYSGKGWTNWNDFFGQSPKITSEERKTRILTKLGISPTLLKEDTPIHIIYMHFLTVMVHQIQTIAIVLVEELE